MKYLGNELSMLNRAIGKVLDAVLPGAPHHIHGRFIGH